MRQLHHHWDFLSRLFLTVRENLARSYKFENCCCCWDFTLLLHGKHQILHGKHQILHGKHQVLHGMHQVLHGKHQILHGKHQVLIFYIVLHLVHEVFVLSLVFHRIDRSFKSLEKSPKFQLTVMHLKPFKSRSWRNSFHFISSHDIHHSELCCLFVKVC